MNNAPWKAGDDCRVGKHDGRPARFALAAWPVLAETKTGPDVGGHFDVVEELFDAPRS
ncbi:hypothetical protein [Streptomyces fradiae]|jgi:hypothetical protein|uniref:hypothetical protein n=1 Tax=Streptomyces fradiae TaxID=1906 RepID=UPI003410C48D